ncbi:MAG: hypothetical protein IJT97_01645 [Bacteroidaceae bacterium]|nr:hypothetical protein [Bacteroidaceae bacterium]
MKYIPNPLFLLIPLLVVSSCYKDEGNYSYSELNEITADMTETGGVFAVDRYDTLRINPVLQFSQGDIPESDLAYKWEIYLDDWANSEAQSTVLSTEKNLCVQITKPESLTPYAVVLNVTNKQNNTTYRFKYSLSVQPSIMSGLLVLQDDAGTCRLDYFASTHAEPTFAYTHHIPHVYASANGTHLQGTPRGVSFSLVTKSSYEPQVKRIYLWTDQEVALLDAADFTRLYSNNELFMVQPEKIDVQNILRSGISSYQTIMINGTDAHALNQQTSMSYGYQFSRPLKPNSTLTGDIRLSKYIYEPDDFGSWTGFEAILYDEAGQRFVKVDYGVNNNSDLKAFEQQTDKTKAIFDVNNIGQTLQWMGKGNAGQGFSVFTDGETRSIYRTRFNIWSTTSISGNEGEDVEVNPQVYNIAIAKYSLSSVTEGDDAKYFDLNRYANTMLYASSRNIYVYDFASKKATLINDEFPEDEEITAIRIYNVEHYTANLTDISGTLLYVATWDGTEGKIYEFPLNRTTNRLNNRTAASGNLKEPYEVFTGFAKVVDMCVKPQGRSD